jgi:hypothetical protein
VAHVGIAVDGRVVRVAVRPVLLADDGVGEPASGASGDEVLGRVESVAEEVRNGSFAAGFYADLSQGMAGRQWRDAVAAFRAGGLRALLQKARRLRTRHVRAALRAVRRRLTGG